MSLEHANEKPSQGDTINVAADTDPEQTKEGLVEDYEVFQKTEDGVDFRTVGWFKASVIFCKVMFAVGVLSLPTTMSALGAVGGSLSIVAWGAFNTYCFVILGDFRQRHPGCHSIADMAYVVGGVVTKELTGFLFIVAYVLCAGAGIIGVATGLNALSHHATCTVWYALVATIVCALTASVRKLHQFGWLTYAGFASVYIAVLIVVIGVTQRDRPAAAPQTGPYELGYYAIAYPSFASGMVASSTIFYSSAGTSAFLPVISEMRNPKDYKRLCTFSAGQTVKMVAYGVALVGLIVSGSVYIHVSAKYIFVRVLRNSRHLQANTLVHWGTWLGCTFSLSFVAFIFAEAIPIFNYLNALTGSICFAPLAMMLPGWFWLYDHGHYRTGTAVQRLVYWIHWAIIALGVFFLGGGTYGIVLEIVDAYANGTIGSAFSCADNSNST
ncbi:hypothetical protein H2203_000973 [Taxawa tesnikishii (nom. ined.)]|nr:hypothetical protein H2203_000973 [Dothideales sp. JES 119]